MYVSHEDKTSLEGGWCYDPRKPGKGSTLTLTRKEAQGRTLSPRAGQRNVVRSKGRHVRRRMISVISPLSDQCDQFDQFQPNEGFPMYTERYISKRDILMMARVKLMLPTY